MNRARARIFEPPASNNNNTDRSSTSSTSMSTTTTEETLSKNLQQTCKVRAIAKGPVEGSVGFERRRNRRNAANNNNNNNNNNTNNNSNSTNITQRRQQQGRRDTTRGGTNNSRNGRDSRNSSTGNLNSGNTNNNNRQPLYIVQQDNADLQDPDFDRRYDKWAVRHDAPTAPTQHQLHQSHHHSQQQQQNQQMHVPIFSQLLYPYTMRTGPQPPHGAAVHHAGIHVPSAADTVQTQFPYSHPSHAHSSALMFQQLGQSIDEYTAAAAAAGNTNAVMTSTGYDVNARDMMLAAGPAHHLGHAHSAQMEQQRRQVHQEQLRSRNQYQTGQQHLQNTSLRNQVAAVSSRQAPPAYGLDSTVDFPPLP